MPGGTTSPGLTEWLVLAVLAIASAAILVWLMKYSGHGFDFTDEGLYLIWIEDPFRYPYSVSQFGFIYHPLYLLLGGDIAYLRQANVLITFGLATVLGTALLSRRWPTLPAWPRLSIASGLAAGSFALFDLWLVTPNYNSLNLQSLLIAAIGVCWSLSPASGWRLAGQVLVGVGGWLCFMAKPSTAPLLGMLVVAFWFASGTLRMRTAWVPVAVAGLLLLASAWAIDGGIGAFVTRLQLGMEAAALMGGGHALNALLRWDLFNLTPVEKWLFLAAATLPAAGALFLASPSRRWRVAGTVTALLPLAMVVLMAYGILPVAAPLGMFKGVLYLALPVAAAVHFVRVAREQSSALSARVRVSLALFLVVLPHCYAFGTNGNYWWAGSGAAVFWLLPALLISAPPQGNVATIRALAPLALMAQTLAVLFLQTTMQNPYRQPPLALNDHPLEVGRPGSTLTLSEAYARYISSAAAAAQSAGFPEGAPLLDLSGQSPGLLYALRATSPGQAWMIGGYRGSLPLATYALRSEPCHTLASAWLLVEPGGPRSIPETLLNTFGAEWPRDYEQKGAWTTAPGAGSYEQSREQMLWRPTRTTTQAQAACQNARQNGNNK